VTGPALWAHDVYGSRWAVVAPFTSADGRGRWYLWDVDTCGYEVVTVHSGLHLSAESAVAAWRESVGHAAAGAAALTAVDDAETLGDLLSGEVERIRIGGEDEEQYTEFLRSRRLVKTAREAVRRVRGRASARLTAADAKVRFAQRPRQVGYHDGAAGDNDVSADTIGSATSPRLRTAVQPARMRLRPKARQPEPHGDIVISRTVFGGTRCPTSSFAT
jgi:hypothetical protein